jgi:beta-galactosidase/beta-glucuronidase
LTVVYFVGVLLLTSNHHLAAAMSAHSASIQEIKNGWKFCQVDGEFDINEYTNANDIDPKWRTVQQMPSDVYAELKASGDIPDPFIGFNEHKVQWISDKRWVYRTGIDIAKEGSQSVFDNFELLFEGLDTICNVFLVGCFRPALDRWLILAEWPIGLESG